MRVLIALSVVTLVLVLRTLWMVQTPRPAQFEGMLQQPQASVECQDRMASATEWSGSTD